MDNLTVLQPELIPLVQGLKPFLGKKGGNAADSFLNLVQVLNSDAVKSALSAVTQVLPQTVPPNKNMRTHGPAKNLQAAPVDLMAILNTIRSNQTLPLFLVFVLLLAGTPADQ